MSEADGIHDPSYRKGQHDTLEWLREKLGEPNLPTLTACGKRIADLRARLAEVEAERDRLAARERHFAEALSVADGGQYRADWDGAIRRVLAENRRLREAAHWLARHAPGTPVPDWVDRAVNAPAAVEQDGAREGQG